MLHKNFALLICDLQTKTIPQLYHKKKVIYNVNKLLYMKKYIPKIKVAINAEFIPEKLGILDNSINSSNIDYHYRKDSYSMKNEQLMNYLHKFSISDIIITGMETQWCINRSTFDLSKNFNIYIPYDAIGNKLNNKENKYDLLQLKNYGAQIMSTDFLICSFLKNNHEEQSKKYLQVLKNE
jgi:hypothetical protein